VHLRIHRSIYTWSLLRQWHWVHIDRNSCTRKCDRQVLSPSPSLLERDIRALVLSSVEPQPVKTINLVVIYPKGNSPTRVAVKHQLILPRSKTSVTNGNSVVKPPSGHAKHALTADTRGKAEL
jgi:hypothetical protein